MPFREIKTDVFVVAAPTKLTAAAAAVMSLAAFFPAVLNALSPSSPSNYAALVLRNDAARSAG